MKDFASTPGVEKSKGKLMGIFKIRKVAMNWIDVTSSSWGPKLVRALCSVLPRTQAYQIGDRLTSYVAHQKELPLVKGLHANMAIVYGLPEGHPRVLHAVNQLFRNLVRGYVDFYKSLEKGPAGIFASCEFDELLLEAIDSCLVSGQGLVLVGAHSCSFDLLLLALTRYFPEVQALTKSDPKGSSAVINKIRQKFGVRITPISVHALREAIQRLKSGGVVVIAADVPVETGAEMIFFRRKTRLPIGHVRLAAKTGAKMIVGTSQRVSDGLYRAVGAQAHQPLPSGNRDRDVIRWAQHSLFILERFIHKRPYEWFMPVSLWPDPGSQGQPRKMQITLHITPQDPSSVVGKDKVKAC
jgi:lauroyl/myristoyl acyltransferase